MDLHEQLSGMNILTSGLLIQCLNKANFPNSAVYW